MPIEYGYNVYYKQYAGDERFEFIQYENKGHMNILNSDEYINYMNRFYEECSNYFSGRTLSLEERIEYVQKYLDREIYCNGLDNELFDRIITFYNSNL